MCFIIASDYKTSKDESDGCKLIRVERRRLSTQTQRGLGMEREKKRRWRGEGVGVSED